MFPNVKLALTISNGDKWLEKAKKAGSIDRGTIT
ncbi:hypothetical protein MARI151_20163 [Maribacter litoralis]|uniref:Uncharacterized protein n=1 Tax=Maribacter litoralis TaxID=2059726 RepID=A0A653P9L6_9FLAO|nr:hypothetical protein MARI151_20163 [Maribacter litoralis]